MITRYLKPISVTGSTFSDFIDAIESTFVEIGFTEVTPTYSSGSIYVKAVRFGNLEIDIFQVSSTCAFKGYLHYSTESYHEFTGTVPSIVGTTPYGCNLCFFVSDDGKFIACNIASKTEQISKGQINFFNIITDNEEICGMTRYVSSSLSTEFRSTDQYAVSLTPKRTYQKTENVFFLDEGVPVLKSSDNSYLLDLPYLTTLGGAEIRHTYTMTNGDNYYCLTNNIAVKFDTTGG